jgi:hypothetical protein
VVDVLIDANHPSVVMNVKDDILLVMKVYDVVMMKRNVLRLEEK